MLGALTINGLEEGFLFEGSVDGENFLYFIKNHLVSILKPGQIVIFDNVSTHFTEGVEEAICSAGAELLLLPPYSPDLSPIEECWSKVKNSLRKAAARTKEALYQSISEAFSQISKEDALGWFKHCGFCTDFN